MKYISMDIETTGLDPMTCQILEVGAVLADTDGTIYAQLHLYIANKRVYGEPYALKMNERILERIEQACKQPFIAWDRKDPMNFAGYTDPDYLAHGVMIWLKKNGYTAEDRVVFAGKNFGSFDWQFLKYAIRPALPDYLLTNKITCKHRFIDPGMLYFNPDMDREPPDLGECLERAGLKKTVTHRALDDAHDVVNVITAYYAKRRTPSSASRRRRQPKFLGQQSAGQHA